MNINTDEALPIRIKIAAIPDHLKDILKKYSKYNYYIKTEIGLVRVYTTQLLVAYKKLFANVRDTKELTNMRAITISYYDCNTAIVTFDYPK